MDVKEKMAEQGFFRVVIPKSYGGMGLNLTDLCLVIEEIARFNASMAITFQSHTTSLRPLLLTRSRALKDEIFPKVVKEKKVIAFAITEANAGSDSGAIQTSAVLQDGNYVLNGTKLYITNGSVADYVLCSAVTSPDKGHRGISIFLVDATAKGFSVGKKESKMGLRASPTTEIVFANVVVPASRMVGEEGGFPVLMKALEAQRVTIGAQSLGVAVGALEYAMQFAREKIHFGKPLIEQQGIQFMVADMVMQVEAARAFIYKVTEMYDQKFPTITAYASISKCFPSDVAMRVTTDAVQLMGSPTAIFGSLPAEGVAWQVPCVRIVDHPRFGWRGLLVDPARHFIPVSDFERYLDVMAVHKLNRLQIHLTDDQGWRIEIRKYPELVGVGSVMDFTALQRGAEAGRKAGGYYTQDDIRHLVRYAAARHITLCQRSRCPRTPARPSCRTRCWG